MFSKESYKKIINRFNRERKYRLSVFSTSPHFDWKVLLTVALICLILITGSGFQIYNTILESSEYEVKEIKTLDRYIKKEKIDDTLNKFSEKESKFNAMFLDQAEETIESEEYSEEN